MADVEISYKGNVIASMSASGTKTLLTEGKYLEDDIGIVYTSPGGGGGSTLITKSITQNGTYNASSDNADGYSSVTVNVSASGALQPFDTYEFNVPSDINYQDATGTDARTLATFSFNQATYDKCDEYSSISASTYPFAKTGYARVMFSVVPKNYSAIAVADATYIKNIRKDSVYFLKNSSGIISRTSPYWRASWRLKTNGTWEYAASLGTGNELPGFEIQIPTSGTDKGKLQVRTQLSQYNGQMISAGDYVVRLFDLTGTVM